MLHQIKVNGIGQVLESMPISIASDVVNQFEVIYTLDEVWGDFDYIYAYFVNCKSKKSDRVEITKDSETGKYIVTVPPYVLTDIGMISTYLIGESLNEDGDLLSRITTYPTNIINVVHKTSFSSDNGIEPTPDEYEQLIRLVNGKGDNLTYEDDVLSLRSGDDILSSVSLGIFAYDKLKKISPWLYEISYSKSDYSYAYKFMKEHYDDIAVSGGSCSAVYKNGIFGKNFDWNYSWNVDFVVRSSGGRYKSIGVAGSVSKLTKQFMESGAYDDLFKIVPFVINAGVNEKGVFCGTNVVPALDTKDGELFSTLTTGTNPDLASEPVCSVMLNKVILDNCATASDAISMIANDINVYCPHSDELTEEMHFFIGDSTAQYIVEFINNETVVTNVTGNYPWMTNYYRAGTEFDNDGNVIWQSLTDHSTGVKRSDVIAANYDSIESASDMRSVMNNSVKFTNAYVQPYTFIDEFVYDYGEEIGDLTIEKAYTQPELFDGIIAYFVDKYENRDRNEPVTWQTEHSAVYDIENSKLYVVVQEDGTTHEFNMFSGDGAVEWDDIENKPATFPPSTHNHDSRYYTKTETNTLLGGKADAVHTHDDRYYTETEVDGKLLNKADAVHTHTKSQITDFPTIPTKTSDLTNDSGFVDDSYHDNTKVDKVNGKGLSTNDYTTEEKTKLAGLENYDDTDITSRVTTIESKESEWDAKLSDAPSDNKQYARKNGAWTEVESGGSQTYNIETKTLLWTYGRTSEMTPRTILNHGELTGYESVLIEFAYDIRITESHGLYCPCYRTKVGAKNSWLAFNDVRYLYHRNLIVQESSIQIEEGQSAPFGQATPTTDNAKCVPVRIWGLKTVSITV